MQDNAVRTSTVQASIQNVPSTVLDRVSYTAQPDAKDVVWERNYTVYNTTKSSYTAGGTEDILIPISSDQAFWDTLESYISFDFKSSTTNIVSTACTSGTIATPTLATGNNYLSFCNGPASIRCFQSVAYENSAVVIDNNEDLPGWEIISSAMTMDDSDKYNAHAMMYYGKHGGEDLFGSTNKVGVNMTTTDGYTSGQYRNIGYVTTGNTGGATSCCTAPTATDAYAFNKSGQYLSPIVFIATGGTYAQTVGYCATGAGASCVQELAYSQPICLYDNHCFREICDGTTRRMIIPCSHLLGVFRSCLMPLPTMGLTQLRFKTNTIVRSGRAGLSTLSFTISDMKLVASMIVFMPNVRDYVIANANANNITIKYDSIASIPSSEITTTTANVPISFAANNITQYTAVVRKSSYMNTAGMDHYLTDDWFFTDGTTKWQFQYGSVSYPKNQISSELNTYVQSQSAFGTCFDTLSGCCNYDDFCNYYFNMSVSVEKDPRTNTGMTNMNNTNLAYFNIEGGDFDANTKKAVIHVYVQYTHTMNIGASANIDILK